MPTNQNKVNQISRAVVKTVAGMAVSKPEDFIKLAAHAGDELLKGNFSKTLIDTYAFFMNKGEIDAKYLDSSKFADLAPEFNTIANSSFSQDKLDTLRKIFVNIAKDSGDEVYKKYLLEIALTMSEPEIKILLTDYSIATKHIWSPQNPIVSVGEWNAAIANISGLKHESLVSFYGLKLEAKELITKRMYTDKSGISWQTDQSRLTSMGLGLCELMILENDPVELTQN